jgi:hypothetical protein
LTNVLPYEAHQEISQTSINNFSLTICSGMIGRVELKDSPKLSPKSTPKMIDKLGIAIKSDRFRNAMKFDYLFEEQISNMSVVP